MYVRVLCLLCTEELRVCGELTMYIEVRVCSLERIIAYRNAHSYVVGIAWKINK